jgi:hypothetical protein
MTTPFNLLKFLRQLHLYVGIFIAPAILFFALTGALQTFNLHESGHGRENYQPPTWIVKLSRLHKDQTVAVPQRKGPPAGDKPAKAPKAATEDAAPAAKTAPSNGPKPPAPAQKSHLPMKIFFLLVTLGLFSSTLTGIYMAYKYNRSKVLVTGLLLAGILVPLALLPF